MSHCAKQVAEPHQQANQAGSKAVFATTSRPFLVQDVQRLIVIYSSAKDRYNILSQS